MKLKEVERGPDNRMREVSDLRTQFQCEYRLLLKQKLGDTSSDASVTGTFLHRLASDRSISSDNERGSRLIPLIIIIVTIIVGILWILW